MKNLHEISDILIDENKICEKKYEPYIQIMGLTAIVK